MKSARLNRLFNPKSNRCFDVAIDHGFFNEHDFLSGIENMRKTIDVLVAAGPDAIQLTIGLAPLAPGTFPGVTSRHSCCAPTWPTSMARNCRAPFSAA